MTVTVKVSVGEDPDRVRIPVEASMETVVPAGTFWVSTDQLAPETATVYVDSMDCPAMADTLEDPEMSMTLSVETVTWNPEFTIADYIRSNFME